MAAGYAAWTYPAATTARTNVVLMAGKLEIIYQDQNVVAVNKPAGLASIPGRAETDSVLQSLAEQLGIPSTGDTDPRVRVVHRLDKDTSGVMIFALTLEAQRHLSHQFQNNSVSKQYVAIVMGRPPEPEGEIDAAIAPDRQRVGAMKVDSRGKPARTAWKVEGAYRGFSLVRAFPKTGKTHQIRVHLKHLGHPLAVDPLYGPAGTEGGGLLLSGFKRGYRLGKWQEERPLIARLTLHAERLTLELPGGQELTIIAPLPKDMRATINMLEKYGR